MAKESLQRTAIARTAAGKRSKNVRRHSQDRLHASMIKQKKNQGKGETTPQGERKLYTRDPTRLHDSHASQLITG